MFVRRTLLLLAAAALLIAVVPAPASAHASKTTEDGKIRIVWGWLEEPAFSETKNRLDLSIRDGATGAGIAGLTSANITKLAISYGESQYSLGNLSAYSGAKSGTFAGPGNYTATNHVYLTRPGLYVLHIAGTVQNTTFDLEIPHNHEVEPREEIAFPAEEEEDGALEDRIAALEQKVASLEAEAKTQSETPATVTSQESPAAPTPGFGVLAALGALGIALLVLRRRA